jgi:hypothetical protein
MRRQKLRHRKAPLALHWQKMQHKKAPLAPYCQKKKKKKIMTPYQKQRIFTNQRHQRRTFHTPIIHLRYLHPHPI